MKLVLFLAEVFEYEASKRASPLAAGSPEPAADRVGNAVVAFVQCKPRDEERSAPEFARDLLADPGNRLESHGLEIHHTPFGWSLKWTMSVEGHGYAKTFKSL